MVLYATGQMQEARTLCEQGLAIARQVGDRGGEGVQLGQLALQHQAQGQMEMATVLHEQALVIHREVGNHRSEGIVLGNLAVLHEDQGRTAEARALYERALVIAREVGDRESEGAVLANLVGHQGDVEEERLLIEQALAIAHEVGDRQLEGACLSNLSLLHRDQGRMEEQRTLLEQALAVGHEMEDRHLESLVLGHLAIWAVVAEGNDVRAGGLADQAAALAEGVDQFDLAFARCRQGHVALMRRGSAAELLEQARALVVELGATPESDVGEAVARLERAEAAFQAGEALVCAHCPEDLTFGQLRWLREHRPEAIQPEVMARLNEDGTLRPEEPPDLCDTTPG